MIFHHRQLVTLVSTMTIFSVVVRGFSPLTRGGRALRQTPCAAILHNNNKLNVNTNLYSTASAESTSDEETKKTIPPMTLLSGFLGSGKTSTLQSLLSNTDGIRIGVIVNDVASVNIDSKLISNPNNALNGEDTVELQNGCACCSLADELLTSVEQLTNNGQRELDHIVIELSGVADPEAVKTNWEGAEMVSLSLFLLPFLFISTATESVFIETNRSLYVCHFLDGSPCNQTCKNGQSCNISRFFYLRYRLDVMGFLWR